MSDKSLSNLLSSDFASGLLLLLCAAAAFALANSPFEESYYNIIDAAVPFTESWDHPITLLIVVNDGLMAIFFFLVGLEIKREILQGELSTLKKAGLPVIAAAGGMIVPALIYYSFNVGTEDVVGWGIPVATDIAFSLAVLGVLGTRVPPALKIFLVALAIADDIGAVLVIALFYSAHLNYLMLAAAAVVCCIMLGMNKSGVESAKPYIVSSLVLWAVVLLSGVHATVAGVAASLFIPIRTALHWESPLHKLEHNLKPWVAWLIMPLFAFANSGVALPQAGTIVNPVTIGVASGLAAGKPIGIFMFCWVAVKARLSDLPDGTNLKQILAVGMVAGIGFTMSLFISSLAFEDPALSEAKIGILFGSAIAAFAGSALLYAFTKKQPG